MEAVLEIDDQNIAKENNVDDIIERLNRLFKKDSTITKYQNLEAFETFRRPASLSIQPFLNEFDKLRYKTKSYGTVQSDDNLSNNHDEQTKATKYSTIL